MWSDKVPLACRLAEEMFKPGLFPAGQPALLSFFLSFLLSLSLYPLPFFTRPDSQPT